VGEEVLTGEPSARDATANARLADLLEKVDAFRGRPCSVSELPGGLTNRNYKVTTPEGAFVLRVSSPEAGGLGVNREHEYRNTVIAATTGVGAPVVDYLPMDGAMVVGFLEGATFTDDSFQIPGNLERVALACKVLHDGPKFVNDFNMFELQRGYLELVLEYGYRLPDDYLDFTDVAETLRKALAVRQDDTVACNNDLLAGNFIDGGDRIHLIDYEYSGNNDACFELGNIWSECHLTREQLEELVTWYYGRRLTNRIARARLQGLMSQYGWTLWASIQDATSDLDFDFWTWGLEKYDRAVATFRSPELGQLLELVQGVD
jgi:thiamine kinase-like enzyme